MINEETRKDLIPDIDGYADEARELEKNLDYLIERHGLYKDPLLSKVATAAYALVASLGNASDELKRRGEAYVRDYALTWYSWHYEDDETPPAIESITIEAITYEGKDRWTVIIHSPEHGRERMTVDSNASTWEQMYSFDPA